MTKPHREDDLAVRNAGHVPEWYVMLNEAETADLASGYVPQTVMAMCRMLLDQADIDRRRAARPVAPPRRHHD